MIIQLSERRSFSVRLRNVQWQYDNRNKNSIQIDDVQYLFQTASLDVFTPTLRDGAQCGTHATTALLPILG